MKFRYLFLACVGLLVTSMCFTSATTWAFTKAQTVVHTEKGAVRGAVESSVRKFQNIPYAAPPINQLRWQSPQPTAAWSGVKDATKPGNACLQGAGGDIDANTHQDEDCLYLNVTTKANDTDHTRKPVMVWLHGGGFTTGTASSYDPTRMVDQGNVIVVTINYRLGIFGSYAQSGLKGEGTFGLQDQQAALRWVQRNIQKFGGDSHNVTLFGESAGGVSTCGQLTSPAAKGLFQKAIMESGSCDTNVSLTAPGTSAITPKGTKLFETVQTAEQKSQTVANLLGCNNRPADETLDCLRNKKATDVQKYMNQVATPAYGGSILPQAPWEAIKKGAVNPVPVLSGANHDESRLVVMASALTGFPVDAERYDSVLQQAFGTKQDEVRRVYDPDKFRDTNNQPSPALALAALQTDRDFVCPQYDTNAKLARQVPVYGYDFADQHAISSIPSFIPGFSMGAAHTSELYDLFDLKPQPVNADGTPQTLTSAQQQLASTMISYWTHFAHRGTPNKMKLPYWPRYNRLFHSVLNLQPGEGGVTITDGNQQHNCGMWSHL